MVGGVFYFMEMQSLKYRQTLSDIGRKLTDHDMKSVRFICKDVKGLTKRDLELEEPLDFFEKLEERGVLSYKDTDFLKVLLEMVHRRDCLEILEDYQNGASAQGVNGDHRRPVQAMDQDPGYRTDRCAFCGVEPVENDGNSLDRYQSVAKSSIATGDFSDGCVPQTTVKTHAAHQNRGMIQQVRETSMGEDLSDVFEIVVEEIGRDWRQLARKLHLTETEIIRISEDYMRDLREQSMQCLLLWKRKMRSQATKAALVEALTKCRMLYIVDMVEGSYSR